MSPKVPIRRDAPPSDASQAVTLPLLNGIVQGSPVPTFVIDLSHHISHWNRACEAVLGYSAERMLGTRDQWMPFYPHPRPVMADVVLSGDISGGLQTHYRNKYHASTLVPGAFEAEDFFPHMGPEGTWLFFTAAVLLGDDGKAIGAIETLQDVSARRRAEIRLQEQNEQSRALIEHFPSGVLVMDANMRITHGNALLCQLLGLPPERLASGCDRGPDTGASPRHNNCSDCGPLRDYVEMAGQARLQGSVFERQRANGMVLEVRGSSLPGDSFVTSFTDITARKRDEERMAQLLAEQQLIFENAHVGIQLVRHRHIVKCNRRQAEQFGYASANDMTGMNTLRLFKTREAFDEAGRVVYAQIRQDGSASYECEMVRSDGTPVWMLVSGRCLDRNAIHEGSIWTYHDITDRRRQARELMLADRVFAHSLDAQLITDPNGVIQKVNDAFCQITGYARDEAIGRTPSILKSGRHTREFYANLWHSVKTIGTWEGEVWDRRKSGEIYPKWLSIAAVRGTDGALQNFIASFSDITARKAAEERVRYIAHHDPLTSLPNRLLLRDRFSHMMDLRARSNKRLAFMFLDLDHFSRINDSLGHRVGDELLVAVVGRLRSCLRDVDIISREGGDEFIVLLGDIEDAKAAIQVAEKLLLAVAEPIHAGDHQLHVTASMGISIAPDHSTDFDTLLQSADTAMYHAKDNGRDHFSIFCHQMNDLARHRLDIRNRLSHAIHRSELQLVYQPQVYADTGRVYGCEALMRWRTSDGSFISPNEFIPAAEESGLILPIGDWAMDEACRQARIWRDQGLDLRVAVNVSGVQVFRSDLVSTLKRCARDAGIDPSLLELELTESTLVDDSAALGDIILALRALGVTVAIDDFGTGYSSLSYLKRFAIHKLKIDRAFISDIDPNPDAESNALTKLVIGIARTLKLRAIAEGVETLAQLDLVRSQGCNEVQGYYFSRPLAPDAFVNYARTSQQAS